MSEFGKYLRALRKAKGFGSSHKLAEASGVSQPFISQIELGKRMPSPDVIRKLSQALGVTHIGMMIKAGHLTEEEVLIYGGRAEKSPRNREIASMYESGKKIQEIADAYGISRQRVHQIIDQLGVERRPKASSLPCKVDGCKNLANGSKGYCSTHYQRWLLKGDVSDPVFKKRTLVCAVEGCGRPYKSSGLCDKHSVNFTINKNKGLIADMEDFLNVQKAKRLMGKTYARFSEIRKFMESNKHHFK